MSTLGLNPGTRSKKNVLSMLLKSIFRTLPILHSLSWCFMLPSSVVLQSYTMGLMHSTAYNIRGRDTWWSEASPTILVNVSSMAFRPSTYMELVGI